MVFIDLLLIYCWLMVVYFVKDMFATRLVASGFDIVSGNAEDDSVNNGNVSGSESKSKSRSVTRVVCVPVFAETGQVVLVDVHSPSFDTAVLSFDL